jgi:hypothetical protein
MNVTDEKIYVIAGNYMEFRDFVEKNIQEELQRGNRSITLSHYIFVTDIAQLRGLRNPHGYFYGTWRERLNIIEILMNLIPTKDEGESLEYMKKALSEILEKEWRKNYER